MQNMRRIKIVQTARSLLKRGLPQQQQQFRPPQSCSSLQLQQRSFQTVTSGGRSNTLSQNHDEFSQHAEAKQQAKEHERKVNFLTCPVFKWLNHLNTGPDFEWFVCLHSFML